MGSSVNVAEHGGGVLKKGQFRSIIPISAVNGGLSASAGLSNITWQLTEEVPCSSFSWARIGFANTSLDVTTLKGFFAAVDTAQGGNPEIPQAGGATATIVPFKFLAATSADATGATSGREYNASRTADAGVACLPEYSYSDWTPVTSLARVDGGTLPLICARVNATSAGTITRMVAGTGQENPSGTTCRKRYLNYKSGDSSGSATWSGTLTNPSAYLSFHIEVLSSANATVVMGVGDSLCAGAGSTSGIHPAARIAVDEISTPSNPWVFVNTGWGGTKMAHWYSTDIPSGTSLVTATARTSKFQRHLDVFKPNIVLIPSWTVNNPAVSNVPTQSEFDLALAMTKWAVSETIKSGAVPIIITPYGKDGYTNAGVQALWGAYVAKVKSEFGQLLQIDAATALFNASGNYLSASYTSDGTHPSDTGYGILKSYIKSILSCV